MKKIILSLIGSSLILASTGNFAANKTDMMSKWICTTNASSSDVVSDKTADDKMAKNATSVSAASNFAQQNCRDCTKITCEAQN